MHLYHQLVDRFARSRAGGWVFVHVLHSVDKRLMRWTAGAVSSGIGTAFHANAVLLRCVGAKTGRLREVPLLATALDGRWVLVASAAGQPTHPAWYYNLKADARWSLLHPKLGELDYVAHEAQGEERERAWRAVNAQYSGYEVYQQRTRRCIPLLILSPSGADQKILMRDRFKRGNQLKLDLTALAISAVL